MDAFCSNKVIAAAAVGIRKSKINVSLRNLWVCFRATRKPISLITKFSEVVGLSSKVTDSDPSPNPVAVAEVEGEGLSITFQYVNFTIPLNIANESTIQEKLITNESKTAVRKVIISAPSKRPMSI